MMNLILVFSGVIASYGGYLYLRLRQSQKQAATLQKEKEQLKTQKAVAETKVKNYQVKQKNEENLISRNRTSLLERMHHDGDLRD
ncbi:DUF2681 domain-containing protein [Haemophilus parainfluenzae]|uniref:DUF2681 domain-containing protein n=1 Tax=Haemophilus parainfluenzae TaxID=729 RepID=UPI002E333B8F|nr:DUF2681 domain-containing protein [Haemophilus parainfluenzae]